jgi:hypothetical protein
LGLGRWSRWHGNRRGTFLAQVGEDPRDHAGFGDNKDGSIDNEKSGIYKADKKVAPLPKKD